jgi:BMFP domain-containing protein YqiC
MVNVDLIKQKLPEDLWAKAQEYTIPDAFLANSPELIVLILNSKSIDNKDEKQSWFNLLPLMTQEQIDKLRDILVREKQKLEEIEKKYEQKKVDIKAQYTQKREEGGYKKTMIQLQQKEEAHQDKQEQEADSLLAQI